MLAGARAMNATTVDQVADVDLTNVVDQVVVVARDRGRRQSRTNH
jgi:hypothetical protein